MGKYAKDNGSYAINYSGIFYNFDSIALQLINCCKEVYKDKGGEYVKEAVRFENKIAIFEKRYL